MGRPPGLAREAVVKRFALDDAAKAIKRAQRAPVELSPVEALVHVARLHLSGNGAPSAPKTRGQPKKSTASVRVRDLQARFVPMLREQLARRLKAPPAPPRLARLKAGDPRRARIKAAAEALKAEGVSRSDWVKRLVPCNAPDRDSRERHVRRVLNQLGYPSTRRR